MSKQIITMTIDADLIKYLEDLASANHRSRSGMMEQLIREEYQRDQMFEDQYNDEFGGMRHGK